jgi:hypothetical protein
MTTPLDKTLQWLAVHVVIDMLQLTAVGLRQVVFRPLTWAPAAVALWNWSRDLALASLGLVLIGGVWRSLWAAVARGPGESPVGLTVLRGIVAALFIALVPTGIRWLLAWNNTVVGLFLQSRTLVFPPWDPGLLAASPFLVLALAMVLTGLLVYLSIAYVVRWVHIGWLAAWLPWLAVGWIASGNDRRVSQGIRDLVALCLTQATQAGAWWLAERYLSGAGTLSGMLVGVGGLWFVAEVPGEVRRLLGAGETVRRALPW